MKVLFFAHLKDVTGCSQLELNCDRVDANGLWTELLQAHPGLEKFRSSVRLAKNSEYVGADATFEAHDEIALIPPVSGG